MGAWATVVKKENQALLVPPDTKDSLAHRVLKETQDKEGLLDPKGIRVSKGNQVSQDHQVHQVPLAKLEGKDFLGSRVKGAMLAAKALRDQLDPKAHLAPQG